MGKNIAIDVAIFKAIIYFFSSKISLVLIPEIYHHYTLLIYVE